MRKPPRLVAPVWRTACTHMRAVVALAVVMASCAEAAEAPPPNAASLPGAGDPVSEPNPLGFRGFFFLLQDARLSEVVEAGDGDAERACPTRPFASHSLPLSPLPPLCARSRCKDGHMTAGTPQRASCCCSAAASVHQSR